MASGAPGLAMGENFGFSYYLWFHVITYQYTEFHATMIPGSALDHISHGVRGPWLRPLTETFNFFLLFLWFRDKPYHYTKFQLPRPFGSAWEFPPTCFSYCSGVLAPPLDINLDF